MKILVLDNYDSFTYNLVHLIRVLGFENYEVYRNDKIDLEKINKYDKILLSPGPGLPNESGIMMDLIKNYSSNKSILGVCLGHQAICESFGGKLINMQEVAHGLSKKVTILNQTGLFASIPKEIMAARYHSWVVTKESIINTFEITALGEDNLVMGVRHKKYDLLGVQFHPESILTQHGKTIISNWLKL